MPERWQGGTTETETDAESRVAVTRARARLIEHHDGKARDLDARAERLRRLLGTLDDAAERAETAAMIAQLVALAEISRQKAARLRASSDPS